MKRTLMFLVAMVVIGPAGITWGDEPASPRRTQTTVQDSTPSMHGAVTDPTADPDMPRTASDMPLVAAAGLTMLGAGMWLGRRHRS